MTEQFAFHFNASVLFLVAALSTAAGNLITQSSLESFKVVRRFIPMKRDVVKTSCAVLATVYFLWCAYDPYQWHLIDGVNLVIHEAGHIVFMPFGEFLMIAGGSLFQIIMPLAFVFYFYRNEKPYSAALVLFWAGESLLNVSVYASDSIAMQLPLLGGQDSIHDWNFMLERLGVLKETPFIAGTLRTIATLVILAAAILSIMHAAIPANEESITEDLAA